MFPNDVFAGVSNWCWCSFVADKSWGTKPVTCIVVCLLVSRMTAESLRLRLCADCSVSLFASETVTEAACQNHYATQTFPNFVTFEGSLRLWIWERMRWAGHVGRVGERRNAYRILVGKPEGKRPLGRPRRRWADNIKMKSWRDRMVWTGSNWLRIRTSGGLLWTRRWTFGFLKIAGNFLNGCTIGSFSGRAQLRKYS
jgi:hypothetical protein